MLCVELRDLVRQYANDNKPLHAVIVSDASFDELQDDIEPALAYSGQVGSQIMTMYGVAIIRESAVHKEDKNDTRRTDKENRAGFR